MLLLQARQLRPKLAFFLFRHRRLDRPLRTVAGPREVATQAAGGYQGKLLWSIAFWLIADKPKDKGTRFSESVHNGDFRGTKTE